MGATQKNVVKLALYIAKGQDVRQGYAALQKVWGDSPTAITTMFVESLTVPEALVEIDAIAVVET